MSSGEITVLEKDAEVFELRRLLNPCLLAARKLSKIDPNTFFGYQFLHRIKNILSSWTHFPKKEISGAKREKTGTFLLGPACFFPAGKYRLFRNLCRSFPILYTW